MKLTFNDILNFVKIRIAISVAISSIVGYTLATNSMDWDVVLLFFSVLSLASGSASLNQVQEWRYDSLMLRTKNRPIPLEKITNKEGLLFSIILLSLGLLILFSKGIWSSNFLPFYLGILAILFYNIVYTPLKRITPYAALPGALIGAIPPTIGWTFASGDLFNPQILFLSLFFFVWQMPHFWLLLIIYEEDYRRAGYPLITDKLSKQQLSRISFFWIISLVIIAFLIPISGHQSNVLTFFIMFLIGMYLVVRSIKLVKIVQLPIEYYRFTFLQLNFFVLLVSLILTFNKFLNL